MTHHPFDGSPTVVVEGVTFTYQERWHGYATADGKLDVLLDGEVQAHEYGVPGVNPFPLTTEEGFRRFKAWLRGRSEALSRGAA